MNYLPLGKNKFIHIYQITMIDLVISCINSIKKADFEFFSFLE